MGITGNLRTMELAELLQWLSNGAKTGTLVVSAARVMKRVYFDKGNIVATASSDPKEHLGHFLVSRGLIGEETLGKAMAMQDETKTLLGKILVTLGAIEEGVLEEMLRVKSQESLFDMFTWEEGEFHFLDGDLHGFTMIPLSRNLNGIVLEGVYRLDEWKRLRQAIPSTQTVVVAVGPLQASDEDPQTRQVLSAVDDDRTVEEIALHSHASEYHTRRILAEQIKKDRIKLVRPRGKIVEAPVDRTAASEDTGAAIDTRSLLKTASTLLETDDYEGALRHFRAASSLEPHNRDVTEQVEAAEAQVRDMLESEGMTPGAMPILARTMTELSAIDISPPEGFLLTRVDGAYDVQTLLKISPMPALDALLVLRRLKRAGHIRILSEPTRTN